MVLTLAGCGTMPVSGPYSQDLQQNASTKISGAQATVELDKPVDIEYVLVELDNATIDVIADREKYSTERYVWPKKEKRAPIKVGVNDTIQLTIYEQNSGGLFVPKEAGVRPGNFVTIPPQTVDETGYITVPYAGEIKVAGKTAAEISAQVTSALSSLALAPQVVVSFTERGGSEVSVFGDVQNARRFSLGFNEEKVLDVIASAGGPRSPGYETWVTLQRDGGEYTIPMDEMILKPQKNIFVQPNDSLYLFRQPEGFSMYGAAGFQGYVTFEKRDLFLSEAIGRAQGLADERADPAEIYIYQEESPKYVKALEEKLALAPSDFSGKDSIPVIYRLNLREHQGFFLANKFPMRDNDIVYVSNAESVEFLKFLNILNTTVVAKNNTDRAFE